MDKNLLKNTAQRLNIYEDSVIKKCEEFLRLYQSKATVKTLDDPTKIILCLDLACQCLNQNIDKDTVVALSGFKKSTYQNHLNMVEKLLGLDKVLSVADICVQMGCMSIKEDAERILEAYKRSDNIKHLDHPQYVAAATYLACKAKKVPLDKHKLVSISRLKSSQWKELLSNFEKTGLRKEKVKQVETIANEIEEHCEEKNDVQKSGAGDETEEIEEYEAWKKRILEEAYAMLQQREGRMEH